MANYAAPGVYVETAEPSSRPIAGVGTSTAGFIGVVDDTAVMPTRPGQDPASTDPNAKYTITPVETPRLITGWEQYKNAFGDFHANSDNTELAHAVYGFFNNGGTRCWVQRIADLAVIADLRDALERFAAIDEIAIVAVPGVTTKAQHDEIIGHCATLEDRVAILDGVQSPTALIAADISLSSTSEDAGYSAIYFPWIKVFDPATNAPASVPPSGHIAGIYARSDGARGLHKVPANEVVRGALDLDRRVSKSDQEALNPDGINVIRSFNGTIKVWGARTRSSDTTFQYISTRRFFNFMRESLDEGMQFVVFEPNTPALWQRISRTANDFLLRQWRNGALFGETPQQAFFVKCDADTNPPDLRALGQVVTEIGVSITKPAEFVIFRVQQTTGS